MEKSKVAEIQRKGTREADQVAIIPNQTGQTGRKQEQSQRDATSSIGSD